LSAVFIKERLPASGVSLPKTMLGATVQVAKRNERHTFEVIP